MISYLALQHDLRPLQGGGPIFDGKCPFVLRGAWPAPIAEEVRPGVYVGLTSHSVFAPRVEVVSSGPPARSLEQILLDPPKLDLTPNVETDWYTSIPGPALTLYPSVADALQASGLWPGGRPARVFRVESNGVEWVARPGWAEAATHTVTGEVAWISVLCALHELFQRWFPRLRHQNLRALAHRAEGWTNALIRGFYTGRDRTPDAKASLQDALLVRGLKNWKLTQYPFPAAVRGLGSMWLAEVNHRLWTGGWDGPDEPEWHLRPSWLVDMPPEAHAALQGHPDAYLALWTRYSALRHPGMLWWRRDPELMTTGILRAYLHGLGAVAQVGPRELAWAMDVADPLTGFDSSR